MAIDLLASARSTALISLVAASLAAPVVVDGDLVSDARSKAAGVAAAAGVKADAAGSAPTEHLLAGGVAFEMPASWGRIGASAAARGAQEGGTKGGVGTVVAALCPGGISAGLCADDAKLTFLTYSGRDDSALPMLSLLKGQLDDRMEASYPGFEPRASGARTSSDGSVRYLDYSFTWRSSGGAREQRLAAYRHDDGSGVVVVGAGAALAEHEAAIDDFLAGASEPLAGA